MTELVKVPFANAMAFYHQDGIFAAWDQARRFAGPDGRMATMPDIVAARLATKPGDEPWETWYTTLTAEYLGISRGGKPILIVAHGIGPMATLNGIKKAYSWEFKDKSRNRRGGRISHKEFLELEAGIYGAVDIIDFNEYCARHEYPFNRTLRLSEAIIDPVLKARLGPEAEAYINLHAAAARRWHLEQAGIDPDNRYETPEDEYRQFLDRRRAQHERDGGDLSDPRIIGLQDAANCCYTFGPRYGHREIEDGLAIGHLITTSRLMHMHQGQEENLTNDTHCHEWWGGVRLVGIKASGSIRTGLHPGPDVHELLRRHWPDLLVPVSEPQPIGFGPLVKIDGQWFTQYRKVGAGLDTAEPEFVATSFEKVGGPTLFRTEVLGYYGFFKYDVAGVRALAPLEANAYHLVGDPDVEPDAKHQTCLVQFCRVTTDPSKRLPRSADLARDFDTLMSLVNKDMAA